jgi:hypothetical protein
VPPEPDAPPIADAPPEPESDPVTVDAVVSSLVLQAAEIPNISATPRCQARIA